MIKSYHVNFSALNSRSVHSKLTKFVGGAEVKVLIFNSNGENKIHDTRIDG